MNKFLALLPWVLLGLSLYRLNRKCEQVNNLRKVLEDTREDLVALKEKCTRLSILKQPEGLESVGERAEGVYNNSDDVRSDEFIVPTSKYVTTIHDNEEWVLTHKICNDLSNIQLAFNVGKIDSGEFLNRFKTLKSVLAELNLDIQCDVRNSSPMMIRYILITKPGYNLKPKFETKPIDVYTTLEAYEFIKSLEEY